MMQINVTYDSSVESAPPGFESGLAAAVRFSDAEFTIAVTININFSKNGGNTIR
jgi:hypothetical protein